MAHDLAECVRVGPQHYSNKNWSHRFRCPVCDAIRLESLNYLGCRKLVCDGERIRAVPGDTLTYHLH